MYFGHPQYYSHGSKHVFSPTPPDFLKCLYVQPSLPLWLHLSWPLLLSGHFKFTCISQKFGPTKVLQYSFLNPLAQRNYFHVHVCCSSDDRPCLFLLNVYVEWGRRKREGEGDSIGLQKELAASFKFIISLSCCVLKSMF